MAKTNLKKTKQGYGYKYVELSAIHNYLEENSLRYFQYIEPENGVDYIMTQKQILVNGKWVDDGKPLRGCRIIQATLSGKNNPAQEQRKWAYLCQKIFAFISLWFIYRR